MKLLPFITKLQQRPYEERMRILIFTTTICAVILGAIFLTLAKLQPQSPQNNQNNILDTLKQTAANTGEGLSKISSDVASQLQDYKLPADYHAVSMKKFSVSADKLVIEFEANNPTIDILNIFSANYSNVVLKDEVSTSSPISILTSDQIPFPAKILSKMKLAGLITFPKPKTSQVTLEISNVYFETRTDTPFTEKLDINLNGDVKGANTRLPRD